MSTMWPQERPEIVPLDAPEPGKPLWHGLVCGICGWLTSHTNPAQQRCGLCRMDAHNQSYAARGGRRAA